MSRLAVLIVNYRTAATTRRCVEAVLATTNDETLVYLLDNDSGIADVELLRELAALHPQRVFFSASDQNSGFAAGTNRLISAALASDRIEYIVLLNSDAVVQPGCIDALRAAVRLEQHVDLIAARMLDAEGNDTDSLGITLFRSTLASNRKQECETLLGPSGGCALLTRRVLEDLAATHGEWFDETFFCYAEDTDLAVRARWLGYNPGFAGDAVAHHAGSLSSGGRNSDFVLYHGIRNSIWWLVKSAPLGWFLRSLPLFIALHFGIVLRHVRRSRARVVWRLYRDAIRGIGAMRRKREVIRETRRVPAREFSSWVEPHFYQRDYVRRAWRELFRRGG